MGIRSGFDPIGTSERLRHVVESADAFRSNCIYYRKSDWADLVMSRSIFTILIVAGSLLISTGVRAQERPNILVIWGDDIGWANLSAYNHAVMGYGTPNIDRIAREGVLFTDHYAQPSCTAGRAAFITGQYPIRSGMTTVGQPGSPLGLQAESPSLAEVLKAEGYRTGQFGKNHLGDRNEHLPTVHGFDEFFGNLYHLNTQEEAERLAGGIRSAIRHTRCHPLVRQ